MNNQNLSPRASGQGCQGGQGGQSGRGGQDSQGGHGDLKSYQGQGQSGINLPSKPDEV